MANLRVWMLVKKLIGLSLFAWFSSFAQAEFIHQTNMSSNSLREFFGNNEFQKLNGGSLFIKDKLTGIVGTDSQTKKVYCISTSANDDTVHLMPWGLVKSGEDLYFNPYQIVINSQSEAYITDIGNSRVVKIKVDFVNQKVSVLDSWGMGPNERKKMNISNPHDIALDKNENVYIADSGNNRILVLDKNGSLLRIIGINGKAAGQFVNPFGVTVSLDDVVTVADTGNGRLQQFSTGGAVPCPHL